MESSEPWWKNNPEIQAMREQVWAELRKPIDTEPRDTEPRDPDEPDHVLDEVFTGTRVRRLIAARDELAKARADYDAAVVHARAAGLSWGEIATVLGVARQQLHRRFRGRK